MRYVLPAATLLSLGFGLPAFADPMVQPTHAVYGCVDPRAATALAIPDGRLRNRKWVEYVHRTGHCALLPAGQPLAVLAHQGPLALVKSPAATPDTPPVYTQSSDLTEAATPPATDAAAQPPVPPPAAPAPTTGPQATNLQTTGATPSALDAAAPVAATPAAPVVPPSPTNAADGTALPAPPPVPGATTPVPGTPTAEAAQSGLPQSGPLEQTTPPAVTPPASVPPAASLPATAPSAPPFAAPAAPDSTAPAPTATPDASAPVPAVVPATAPPASHSSGVTLLLVLVALALLGLVGAAVAIARQQRRFAHVEDANWPPQDTTADPVSQPRPVSPAAHAEPSPQAFRKDCVDTLERGGWTVQPSFAAGAAREGAPDILARRRDAVLAVRCRGGNATITPEMVDEVAAMGAAAHAHVTVLATAAPMTRRAHDEAMRLHVHVLAQDELGSLSA